MDVDLVKYWHTGHNLCLLTSYTDLRRYKVAIANSCSHRHNMNTIIVHILCDDIKEHVHVLGKLHTICSRVDNYQKPIICVSTYSNYGIYNISGSINMYLMHRVAWYTWVFHLQWVWSLRMDSVMSISSLCIAYQNIHQLNISFQYIVSVPIYTRAIMGYVL